MCFVVILIYNLNSCDNAKRKKRIYTITFHGLFQPFKMEISENSFLARRYTVISIFTHNFK